MADAEVNPAKYKKPMGTYVPPAKRVKAEKFEVGSEDHQRSSWDEHKKKITGLINRASAANVRLIVKELFNCNLIRYKGLFATALLKAQESSPKFTDVYAAILAVINSRIRTIGLLVVNRLILQYRIAFVNNNKAKCLTSSRFIAHLANQEVVHEVLAFQLIDHLINQPTMASIEIVTDFLGQCGAKLEQLNPSYLFETFKSLRDLSLDGEFDTRTQELIDLVHLKRKNKFQGNQPIKNELDLIDEEDRVTHTIELSQPKKEDFHMEFNYFKMDPKWKDNEAKYEEFKKSLLEGGSDDDDDDDPSADSSGSDRESDEESASDDNHGEQPEDKKPDIKPDIKPVINQAEKVIDATGHDLIAFRRMVYLTFRSSIRPEEMVHKLLRSNIPPELRDELCQMILDYCGQERTYDANCASVAARYCQLYRREYAPKFERLLQQFYENIINFEDTNKLRNIAKFFTHMLVTESIDWSCLSCLSLRESATTSSPGRCFIKFLFLELISVLSLKTLKEYIKEPSRAPGFTELLPRDNELDTRFAIKFFQGCLLNELSDELEQELLARK